MAGDGEEILREQTRPGPGVEEREKTLLFSGSGAGVRLLEEECEAMG